MAYSSSRTRQRRSLPTKATCAAAEPRCHVRSAAAWSVLTASGRVSHERLRLTAIRYAVQGMGAHGGLQESVAAEKMLALHTAMSSALCSLVELRLDMASEVTDAFADDCLAVLREVRPYFARGPTRSATCIAEAVVHR